MKKIFTLILSFLILSLSQVIAQNFDSQAEKETRQMAEIIKMNNKSFQKIQKINLERLNKIANLSKLREQDQRYLNLRLDEIDEQYAAKMYKILNKNQYQAFMKYRNEQPFTYAGQAMKYNLIALTKE
jgi:lipopolysaccharide export LptBFGC system permease protein LptF